MNSTITTTDRHAHMTGCAPEIALQFLDGADVSPSTRRARIYHLAYFFTFLQQLGRTYDTASDADIVHYKQTLISRQYSAKTQCAYINTVKRFYSWCADRGFCQNPAKDVKTPDAENKFIKMHLTEAQLVRVHAAVHNNLQLACMIRLMASSGLRSQEICNLNISDIQVRCGKYVVYVLGKGRTDKKEWVPLSQNTVRSLKEYLRTQRPMAKPEDPLFVSTSHNASKGKRISTRAVRKAVAKAYRKAGIPPSPYLTCHSLRHSCAVMMLRRGIDIYIVSRILRHKSIETTKLYLKSDEDEQLLKTPTVDLIDEIFDLPVMAEVETVAHETSSAPALLDW